MVPSTKPFTPASLSGDIKARGIGSVTRVTSTPDGPKTITLTKVLWAPDAAANLISANLLHDKGLTFHMDTQRITDAKGEIWAETTRINGLPHLREHCANFTKSSQLSTSTADIDLWHSRFGHPPPNTLSTANFTGFDLSNASNKVVTVMPRNLLMHAGLGSSFWPEAVKSAVYMLNKHPNRSLGNKLPYQVS